MTLIDKPAQRSRGIKNKFYQCKVTYWKFKVPD